MLTMEDSIFVIGSIINQPYHAWIECLGKAYDMSKGIILPIDEYYKAYSVKVKEKFTYIEILLLVGKFNYLGNWKREEIYWVRNLKL